MGAASLNIGQYPSERSTWGNTDNAYSFVSGSFIPATYRKQWVLRGQDLLKHRGKVDGIFMEGISCGIYIMILRRILSIYLHWDTSKFKAPADLSDLHGSFTRDTGKILAPADHSDLHGIFYCVC